jgi:hypothetical protein
VGISNHAWYDYHCPLEVFGSGIMELYLARAHLNSWIFI